MTAKISVVIPIYNVEKYLPKCIQSVIDQTYQNLEIILVNDGSTDHSGVICDEYALIDTRIKVIHKENRGVSDARNTGIERASGELIGFVDSDDWIDRDMYEILYGLIAKYKADMAICRIRSVLYNGQAKNQDTKDLVICDGVEALIYMVSKKKNYRFEHSITNKLVKKELFDNFKFPMGKLMEDLHLTPSLIYASKKCVYIDAAKYNYRVNREDSIMNSKISDQKIFDELNGYKELESLFFGLGIHEGLAYIQELYISRLLQSHYEVKNSSLENKEKLLVTLEELFHLNFNKSLKPLMNSVKKIQTRLFEFSPNLYDKIHGISLKTYALKRKD